jgi:hypothetical protein
MVKHINSRLINLEELSLIKCNSYTFEYTDIDLKFSQPTKIRKLQLAWYKLGNCSLDSILQNCPHLEELALNQYDNYQIPDSELYIKFSKPIMLKKLEIHCNALSEGNFDSILLNCPYLNDLSINLPYKWKELINSIYLDCKNLKRLELRPRRIYQEEFDNFIDEFYKTEFFTCSPRCKSTLTHLNLKGFKAVDFKAEYFKNFESLKSIKFLNQSIIYYNGIPQEIKIDMSLWPGYILLKTNYIMDYEIELKRYQIK